MIYTDQAILLKRINSKEKDTILVLLGKIRGRIECVARSSRGVTKKSAKLDLLNVLKVTLADGKSLDVLTEVSVLNSHSKIKENIDICYPAFYLLEITEKLTKINPVHSMDIYPILLQAIEMLGKLRDKKQIQLLMSYFSLFLLNTFGFEIDKPILEGVEYKVYKYISDIEIVDIFKVNLKEVNTLLILSIVARFIQEQCGSNINSLKLIK